MSRHATEMDAASYWRQFLVRWYPKQAGDELVGTVIELIEPPERNIRDRRPRVIVQTKDGRMYEVVGHQARLAAELVDAMAVTGDAIKITYHGEAEKAVRGFNKAKEFTVEVRRKGSQPQPRTSGEPGEVTRENGSEAGSKAT